MANLENLIDYRSTSIKDGLEFMEELLSELERSQTLLWRYARSVENLYRIYLLARDGSVQAAEFYPAQDKDAAAAIAASLHASCSDAFDGYELWRGTQRVAEVQRSGDEADSDAAMVEEHQQVVLDLEVRLHDGFACVNRSRKLVEAMKRLRKRQFLSSSGDQV